MKPELPGSKMGTFSRETQRRAALPKKISFDRRKFAPYLEKLGSDKEIEELFLEFLRQRVN